MPTLAIIGAGPSLGLATAARFGAEGFDVGLVARNRDRPQNMQDTLAKEGPPQLPPDSYTVQPPPAPARECNAVNRRRRCQAAPDWTATPKRRHSCAQRTLPRGFNGSGGSSGAGSGAPS
jgi:NAD(P)-dependent dehydrogenase (short-subunit alcohol dehydrogenase family)